jgi:hypothetical protein
MNNFKNMFAEGTMVLEKETAESIIKFKVENDFDFWDEAWVVVKKNGVEHKVRLADMSIGEWVAFDPEGIEVEEEVTQQELEDLKLI